MSENDVLTKRKAQILTQNSKSLRGHQSANRQIATQMKKSPNLNPKASRVERASKPTMSAEVPLVRFFYWSKHENFGNQRVLGFPSSKTEKYAESVTVILPRNKQEPYYYSSSIYFFNKLPSQNS